MCFVRLGDTDLTEVWEMKRIKLNEQCGICEEEKVEGIRLCQLFICGDCERNMIHTEPREEKYNYYLQKLKNMNQPALYS